MLRRSLLLGVTALVLLSGMAVAITPGGAPGIQRAGADSTAWRDDFTNMSGVGSSSGVVFGGADVRLASIAGEFSRRGLVVPADQSWETSGIGAPVVMFDEGIYKMWYFGGEGGFTFKIGYATSLDGSNWTKPGVVLSPSLPEEGSALAYPEVLKIGTEYKMWYSGGGGPYRIFFANSTDGITWSKHGVVLDLGPPGSGENAAVYSPSILFDGSSYQMWYSALVPAWTQIPTFYATSGDGLAWTRHGVVLPNGPAGSLDSVGAYNPSVFRRGSLYEMVYSGYGGSPFTGRLLHARSIDGVTWTKLGQVLDALPPQEGTVDWPCVLVEPDHSWKVYYQARGSVLQIYLAIRLADSGWLRSTPIQIPSGLLWDRLAWTEVVPLGTALTVTVRDATSLAPLPGLEDLMAGGADLSAVSRDAHNEIILEAHLEGSSDATPTLDSWEVTWASQPARQVAIGVHWWVIAILVAVTILAGLLAVRRTRRREDPPLATSPGSLPPRR